MPNGVGKTCGNEYFSVPGHTPVIFSEVGGRTLYRLLARDAGGETEGVLLNETVPAWVLDIVVEKKLPKFIKVSAVFSARVGSTDDQSNSKPLSCGRVMQICAEFQVTFYVLPHKDLGYKSFKRERLVANDFLQIRKVIEHVYEKVICNGSEAGSSNAGSPTGGGHGGGNSDRDRDRDQQRDQGCNSIGI